MRHVALAFVRAPVLGQVKRRLAATEGAAEALRIYRRLAEGVHATLLAAQRRGECDLVLCVADEVEQSASAVAAWLPGASAHWAQGAGDLGARMQRCVERAFREGADAVALVGTDVVGLTEETLGALWRGLEQHDVALAPTPDGGYALLGLRRPAPTLFAALPWSTPQVAALTRERARAAGLTLTEIHGLRDVDVAADLEGLVPLVSVLVPVLDEMPLLAQRLAELVSQARPFGSTVEIVVVDGGSRDGGPGVARALGLLVLVTPAGRGRQLAAAARVAQGRWLWTLHADADLLPGTLAKVVAFARRGTHPWGFLSTRIDAPGPLYRVLATLTELRARWLKLPYGDQGVLVRRALYEAVGGYEPVALMEDVLLARRLARHARPALVGGTLRVDGRRWRRLGLLGTARANLSTLARFLLRRRSAEALSRGYDRALR